MKTLQERIELLNQAGVDTSKYELKLDGIVLKNDDITEVVGDKQIENKAFRRWITAQTFRMLNYKKTKTTFNKWTQNFENITLEHGWDVCLRNEYDYMYQFKMMLEEVRVLAKLEIKDKKEFEERSQFFTKEVILATCTHYIKELRKYIKNNTKSDKTIVLCKHGKVLVNDINKLFLNDLHDLISEMWEAENYSELHYLLKVFMRKMNKLPAVTPKCPAWKDAFKGSGAYYSLKNCILFNDMVLRHCNNKKDSIEFLYSYVKSLNNGEFWRLHMLLKDAIEYCNFDLKRSIEKHK